MKRRVFLGLAASGALAGCRGRARPRVVIIGGGFAGATCARTLCTAAPEVDVRVVERRPSFLTGPFTNAVVAGLQPAASIRFSARGLKRHGISVLIDEARTIDPAKRTVALAGGRVLRADYLVVAPGIELRPDALPGLADGALAAWTGDADVEALAARVAALPDGATVAISAPPNPYRCPPGPYERASLIATRLAARRGKVLICDAKDDFTKRTLFELEWDARFPGVVEWLPRAKGGRVTAVEGADLRLESGERIRADLASIIPPQRAARLAHTADLADATGWCPVDGGSFESTRHPRVYVLGDAAIAHPMPKSATSAFGQGKLAALDIARRLRSRPARPQKLINTCYSLTTERHAISVSAVYQLVKGSPITTLNSGTSALAAPDLDREIEADLARQWYAAITANSFG